MSGRRIAKGVYEDRYGFEIRWSDAGHTRTKRFPADTPLALLKDKRQTYLKQARPAREDTGSFPREAVRFLSARKHLVSFKSDRAHLRPWIHLFKRLSRHAITSDQIRKAINDWHGAGYSARTLRHRLRILKQFFSVTDPDSSNPCRGIKTPTVQKTRPRRVSDETISQVAKQLRKQEIAGRLRDMKTRARFLVLAMTGMRPAQLMRAKPYDIEGRMWTIQPAKGDNGGLIYINDEIAQAVTLFVAAQAWGVYDSRSFSKTLQRNGWPKGIRPYTLRHRVGQHLRASGADLGDIQDHLGHASPATTRKHYLEPDLERLKATSERLVGRLDPDALLRTTTTTKKKRKSTSGENRPRIAPSLEGRNDTPPNLEIEKTV